MPMRLALALAALLVTALPGVGYAEEEQKGVIAMQAGGLFVHGDIVQAGTCILWNRFSPGERVVFRARVTDAQTGQVVPDAEVVARLEDGTTISLHYGPHPPPHIGPSFEDYWTGVWAIRPDMPMGIVRFTIEATAGSRTGRFEPFNNMNSLLMVVPQS
jgi:hypothetical protein